jgi:uncharacterized protein YecE (DUF72 family)
VYPADAAASTWFATYARRFDTVELNSTFYRLPAAATVRSWAEQAPSGFCYAVKLGQFGSHRMKLRDPHGWLAHHLERVELLGRHLGPNLVQLPPRWRRNAGRLDEFLSAAPRRLRWAVELRDRSWLDDEVFDVLARHGAALCIHDLLDDHPRVLTTDWTYVRFHGPDATHQPYRHRYGRRRLDRVAGWLGGWLEQGHDVFAYFNNDYEGNAVVDAEVLREMLTVGSSPARAETGAR